MKRLLTARQISLGLILLLVGLMYLSTIIPQRIDSTPETLEAWRQSHASLLWLVDSANLHSVYAQPWFSVLILFALLSLGVSSFEQLKSAYHKLYSCSGGDEIGSSVAEEHLRSVASSHGYIAVQSQIDASLKFVKNPWGYFGGLTLHAGITLVLAASLYVALTGRQGALILLEGEETDYSQQWNDSEYGIFSSPLKLPGFFQLDRLRVSFDSRNQPLNVSSDISISNQTANKESLTVSINKITRFHGLRIYHTTHYGDVFTVAFSDKNGALHTEKIAAQQPLGLSKAGYSSTFKVNWSPRQFAAKYYADVNNGSMTSGNPLLVLRMLDGKTELSRTALTLRNPGTLGEYRVRLLTTGKWAKIVMVDISGMPAIFVGFALVMLGGLLHYMAPPRELIGVMQPDRSYRVTWKAPAFKDFYKEERDGISQDLNREAIV